MIRGDIIKGVRLVVLLLLGIIIFIIGFLFYNNKFIKDETIYYELINSYDYDGNDIVSVGVDNNNDKGLDKGIISIYNDKFKKTKEKIFNIGNSSIFNKVISLDDGYLIVGNINKFKTNKGIIVKYNKKLEIEYTKENKYDSIYYDIKKYNDNYIICGYSNHKGYILIIDKNGKKIKSKDLDDNTIFNEIFIYDNDIFVVGSKDKNKGIIYKLDENLEVINSNYYNNTDEDGFTSIVYLNDNLYISLNNKTKEEDIDASIIRYDYNLNYIDELVYNNKEHEKFVKLISDEDKVIAIGNVSNNTNRDLKEFNYDGIIASYDIKLENFSVEYYGNELNNEFITDIKKYKDGFLAITYSNIEDGSLLSKFININKALKVEDA